MFEVLSGCNVIGHGIFGSMASNYEPPQPPNYDNIEMEGMGSLTLPNSLKAPIERFQLLGNSIQGCTIKVLSTELEQGTINAGNGENFPSNYRVRTKGFSDIQKGKYKVTCEGAKQANVIFYSTDGIYKNTLFKAHTVFPFYFTANEACKIRVAVSNGTEAEAVAIKPENVKSITVATEETLEYPQGIVSAGKYDETSGKYLVDVNVTGKNLFDISKYNQYDDTWTNTAYATKILKLKPNTTYTMSCKRLVDKPKQYVIFNIVSGIKVGKGVSIQINPDLSLNYFYRKGTFTTDETGEIKFNYYVDCPKEKYWFTEVIGDIQIELGSTQTAYDAYKEPQTTQIALDEPLRGIGEYKDVVTKDSVLRKIKEIVFDGDEVWKKHFTQNKEKTQAFGIAISDISNKKLNVMSDKFIYIKDGFITDEPCIASYGGTDIWVNIEKTKASTVEEFKVWLSENPVTVQYVLKEPTTEPLQTELGNLHTYNGTTIVSVDSGEVETGIECTYRKGK